MATIGTLTIDFAASIARLEQDVKKAANAVKGAAGEMESAVSFAKTGFLALAAVWANVQFFSLIKGAADAADRLNEMGVRLSIATQDMAGLSLAAQLAGIQQETLNGALRKMATNVAEAARGGEDARDKFEQLGLSANQLSKLPLNRQFEILIDRLAGVENTTQRVALAQGIMGRSGSEMLSM
ncbi:MAG: hypothetical protein ACREUY_02915, partial [Burkholderiales bacterium]